MDFVNLTRAWFYEAVKMDPKCDSELRDVLLRGEHQRNLHPKVEKFLENLDVQIKRAQDKLWKKRKVVKPETVKGLVYDFTGIFLRNMEAAAKKQYESDIARIERETKIQEHKDMEATLAGKPSGIFEEAGVIVDETTRKDQVLPGT